MATRRCIKCDHDLEPRVIVEVQVDVCPRCRGIWLDAGEIQALASDRAAALAEVAGIEKQATLLGVRPLVPESRVLKAPCPGCGGKLGIARFGPTTIEVCTACQGIFLDRGELEKAMTLVEGEEAATLVALVRSMHTSGAIGA